MVASKDTQGIRVAVYGSLRKGLGNHDWALAKYDAEFLGTHVVDEKYRMISLGGFPAVLCADEAHATEITVEVYRVTDKCLEALDSLEGHPNWYKREKIDTPWKKAWMYVMPADGYKDHKTVESGDWLDHYTSREAS